MIAVCRIGQSGDVYVRNYHHHSNTVTRCQFNRGSVITASFHIILASLVLASHLSLYHKSARATQDVVATTTGRLRARDGTHGDVDGEDMLLCGCGRDRGKGR